jgi:hypothetical protein
VLTTGLKNAFPLMALAALFYMLKLAVVIKSLISLSFADRTPTRILAPQSKNRHVNKNA